MNERYQIKEDTLKMNSAIEMNVIPIEEVTQAIVTAAKRVRKTPVETTIVNQIVEDIQNGKFADEAAELLKNIFGTKFCVAKGLMEPEAKPKKERKPRKKVETDATDLEGEQVKSQSSQTPVLNADSTEEATKEKKPRKKAVKPVTDESTEDCAAKEKKPRKKPVKESTEESTDESAIVVKEKKPRKKPVKPVVAEAEAEAETSITDESVVVVVKEKKPRKKPVKPVPVEAEAEAVTDESIEEPVKEKKPRKRAVKPAATETVIEAIVDDIIPITENVFIDEVDIDDKVIQRPVLDEFSREWSEELLEEELSDIEPEEE